MIRIDQALVQEFISGGFDIPIAHENVSYKATDGLPYAELLVLQNNRTALSMNDTDQTDGVFRVLLSYPVNQGAIGIKQKAQQIMDHFRIGKRCYYSDVNIVIQSQQRQPGLAEDGWYKIIVTFGYRANITRIKA